MGEFQLNGVPVSPEGCEGRVSEIRRDRCGLFSEQAEVEQFIDIDDAVGQPQFFDQDAFAFYFTPDSHFIDRDVLHRVPTGAVDALYRMLSSRFSWLLHPVRRQARLAFGLK